MIHIAEGLWVNSLFGLPIIIIISLVNIILSRRKTLPVILLDQFFFCGLAVILFGHPCIIYASVFTAFVVFKKYWDRYRSENSALDYSSSIFSISRLVNNVRTSKSKEIVVGRVLPTNHKMIKYNMQPIELTETILSGHTLITGASGSGKTHSMLSLMKQSIDKGKPCILFDYKGEVDILDELEEYCKANNIPYNEFSTRRCTFNYDPLVNLNSTGKVEAILNTRRWSRDGADEHYKTSMQLAIQGLVHAYDDYRKQHNDNSNYVVGLYKFCSLYSPQQNERDGFNTVLKMLEILLSSRAKELFGNDKQKFSCWNEGVFVTCFSFVSSNKALASSLSSFIFQDIMDRGTKKHYDPRLLLCIDEFASLDNSTLIKDILEKGRSGGIQTIFSIQDINDMADKTSIFFVQSLLGTINNFMFHNGATQQTAELMSGVQRWSVDFDIMSLQKPLNGKPPTALFISKYPLLNKKGSQEYYKIVPYSYNKKLPTQPVQEPQVKPYSPTVEVPEGELKTVPVKVTEEPKQIKDFNESDVGKPVVSVEELLKQL